MISRIQATKKALAANLPTPYPAKLAVDTMDDRLILPLPNCAHSLQSRFRRDGSPRHTGRPQSSVCDSEAVCPTYTRANTLPEKYAHRLTPPCAQYPAAPLPLSPK